MMLQASSSQHFKGMCNFQGPLRISHSFFADPEPLYLLCICVFLCWEGKGGKCKRTPKINGITNALDVWEGDMM